MASIVSLELTEIAVPAYLVDDVVGVLLIA
jgi:hypothetical protein